MNDITLTEQQRQTGLERISNTLQVAAGNTAKFSAQAISYGIAFGGLLTLSPHISDQLLIASPVIASLISTVAGDLIAGFIEEIVNKEEPTPEEIMQLLEELANESQISHDHQKTLLKQRMFMEVMESYDRKMQTRLDVLEDQGVGGRAKQIEKIKKLFESLLQEMSSEKIKGKLAPVDESDAVARYLQWVPKQYNSMQILGMTRPMTLDAIYADVYLLDKHKYEASKEKQQEQFLTREQRQTGERHEGVSLLETEKLIFIVGKPGAGKTTFMRHLALQAARNKLPTGGIPVYIELKRLNTSAETLFDLIIKEFAYANFADAQTYAEQLLNAGEALILLDGLDEVISEKRAAVNDQIDSLRKRCGDSHLLLTCRPHAEKRQFEKFSYVEMADFLPEQVETFVHNWFGEATNTAGSLLKELEKQEHETIQELTRTPLLLALLCIAYADKSQFPKKRHELYERALKVVLKDWDDKCDVKRESVYGQLTLERKEQLLAYVAFHTFEAKKFFIPEATLEEHVSVVTHMFRQKDIERQKEEFGGVFFESEKLFPSDVNSSDIIREIAVQHGLFVKQEDDSFSFSHLTFQEYFAAKYIVSNIRRNTLELLLNQAEDAQWREVFLLTASLLEEADADYFFNLFIARLNGMVANIESMQELLEWVAEKQAAYSKWEAKKRETEVTDSKRIKQAAYKLLALRAWYYSISGVLSVSRTLALNSIYAHIPVFDHVLATVLNLDSDLEYSCSHAIRRIRPHALNTSKKLCRQLGLEQSREQLNALTIPVQNTPKKDRIVYANKLTEIARGIRDLTEIAYLKQSVTEDDINHLGDMVVWDTLRNVGAEYFNGTVLLMECLELARGGNRKEIEAQLLLPV